jgi:hypothetical protein
MDARMKDLLAPRAKLTSHGAFAVLAAACLALVTAAGAASAQAGPGIRGGLSADPDQFFIGGHYVTAPIWDRLRFQPNVEAGFGDDRTVVAFNMEFGYWIPVNAGWHVYFGGGPALNFVSRDDAGDDDVGPGFAVALGLRQRGGLFFEMKVGAFDSPDFKLAVGYTFR